MKKLVYSFIIYRDIAAANDETEQLKAMTPAYFYERKKSRTWHIKCFVRKLLPSDVRRTIV